MKQSLHLAVLITATFLSAFTSAEPLFYPETGILSLSAVSTADKGSTFRNVKIKLNADGSYQILSGIPSNSDDLYVDELVSVYDGDTFKVNMHHLHPLLGKNIRIRTYGIDAPEIDGKCEQEIQLARQAQMLAETTLTKATIIKLTEVKRDNYFRIGAIVYVDGVSFNDIMLNAGLAVPYNPANRMDWCD